MSILYLPWAWALLKFKLKKLQSIREARLYTHKIIFNISFCDEEEKELWGETCLVDMSTLFLNEKGGCEDVSLSNTMPSLLGPWEEGWWW